MGPLAYVSQYALQYIKKIQTEYICSIAPKQSITDSFNAHVQEWVRHTVWTDDCRSWYKNNETGRVNAIWPGSSLHYIEAIRTPRYEDFEITHLGPAKQNPWAFMGMGFVRDLIEQNDVSPYLSVDNIDPKWMRANDINTDKILESKVERIKREWEGKTAEEGNTKEHLEKADIA